MLLRNEMTESMKYFAMNTAYEALNSKTLHTNYEKAKYIKDKIPIPSKRLNVSIENGIHQQPPKIMLKLNKTKNNNKNTSDILTY